MKNRILFCLLTVTLLCGVAIGSPIPSCTLGSLSSYEALVSGCSVGDEIFSNFTYISSAGGSAIAVLASEITVDTLGPLGSGADVSNPNIGLEFNASWTVLSGQSSDSDIGFTVTIVGGSGNAITDAGLAQTSGVTSNGFASVTEKGCGPAPCQPGTWGVLTFDNGGPASQTVSDTIFTSTNSVQVNKDINAVGGTSGYATISLVQDTFSETTTTPEVPTLALAGIGLLGLGVVMKKRQGRKVS